jgi:hypothetical protein
MARRHSAEQRADESGKSCPAGKGGGGFCPATLRSGGDAPAPGGKDRSERHFSMFFRCPNIFQHDAVEITGPVRSLSRKKTNAPGFGARGKAWRLSAFG